MRSSLEARPRIPFILIISIVALLNMIIERVSKIKGVQRNKDVYIFFTIASRVRKRERKSESEEDKFAQRFCLLELKNTVCNKTFNICYTSCCHRASCAILAILFMIA